MYSIFFLSKVAGISILWLQHTNSPPSQITGNIYEIVIAVEGPGEGDSILLSTGTTVTGVFIWIKL